LGKPPKKENIEAPTVVFFRGNMEEKIETFERERETRERRET
jgi:hypothetical protein